MLKRLLALLLALMMAFSLAACGERDDDDDDDEEDDDRVSVEEILDQKPSRETVDPDSLDEGAAQLLGWMGWHTWEASAYDADNLTPETGLLGRSFPLAVHFNDYPGPDCEEFVSNGDPRGQFDSCNIYDAEKFDWVLKHIYHYTQRDLDAARDAADQAELPYYYQDGSWYFSVGGVGGGYLARPVYVETDGSKYYITYASYSGDGETLCDGLWYAVMGHEEIDGASYWTLYQWSTEVPAQENAPNDRLLRDCAGDWLLDDQMSELHITDVEDGRCTVQASFYRMCSFTADAWLQANGRTLVYLDSEGSGFSGRITLDKDALTLRGFAIPDYSSGSSLDDFFEENIFHYAPGSYAPAEESEAPFAEPEGIDVGIWLGTWLAADGEIITVTEATDDQVTLIYSTFDAAGGSMHHTNYTLHYTSDMHDQVAEDESVIASSGYRLVFTLGDGVITLSSRYPDKDFVKQ